MGKPGGVTDVSSTTITTTQPSVHEEVHTEISVHVVYGEGEKVSGGETSSPTPTTTTAVPTTPPHVTSSPTTTTTTTTGLPPPPLPGLSADQPMTCGYKATFYSAGNAVLNGSESAGQRHYGSGTNHQTMPRIDGSRLAAQQTSLVCWTG